MNRPLLSVRYLTVQLPSEERWFPAVDGVTFDLGEGESLAVVGESGCGKTQLARALIGLAPERARLKGSVVLRGRELLSLSERAWTEVRGQEIGMVFQEPAAALDPVQTVGDQIVEAIRRHSGVSRPEARERARALLAEVAFPDPARGLDEYPHRLSGGQRQRACLAIALAADPALLLADEPTTALDATVSSEVLDLLDRLRRERGLALLLITHDLAAVARHTDRALVLYAGRVVEQASTIDLFRSPRHPYTSGLLACVSRLDAGATPSHDRFRAIPGAVPALAFRPRGICAFAPRCPDRFDPCDASEPDLYPAGNARARCFLYAATNAATPIR